MTTTSTSTHQCHRAYPAQSNECRAQRRRGVVPPEPSLPTSSTSVERGRGSEEAALPRVVEIVCWRRMEVAGIYLPPPGLIVPDRMQAKGWDPSIPNGHDKQISKGGDGMPFPRVETTTTITINIENGRPYEERSKFLANRQSRARV